MTIEERFERIEHYTANSAEERRKDREEYKALWRDTQRQIDENTRNIAELGIRIRELGQESRDADKRLEEADLRLQKRIESLVSAIGEFIAKR
jgi:undecaprenyl pyrophosphate synthase